MQEILWGICVRKIYWIKRFVSEGLRAALLRAAFLFLRACLICCRFYDYQKIYKFIFLKVLLIEKAFYLCIRKQIINYATQYIYTYKKLERLTATTFQPRGIFHLQLSLFNLFNTWSPAKCGAFYLVFKRKKMLEQVNISLSIYKQIHSCGQQLTGNTIPSSNLCRFDVFAGKLYPDLQPLCSVWCW